MSDARDKIAKLRATYMLDTEPARNDGEEAIVDVWLLAALLDVAQAAHEVSGWTTRIEPLDTQLAALRDALAKFAEAP